LRVEDLPDGRQVQNSELRIEDGGWRMEDGRWRIINISYMML